MRRFPILAVAILLAPLSIATAQWYGDWGPPGYYASTPVEGYANGLSNMMRSAGVANLLDSQALVYQQQAQSAALDNDVKYAQAYYARKQTRDSYMADKRARRSQTTEAAFRQAPAPPQRLTSNELDPVSGELYWPAGLSGDDFQPLEAKLQTMFTSRAQSPASFGPEQSQQSRALIGEMRALLKGKATTLPNQEWVEADGFLRRLDQEARFASS